MLDRSTWFVILAAALAACAAPSSAPEGPPPLAPGGMVMMVDEQGGAATPLEGRVVSGTILVFFASTDDVGAVTYAIGGGEPFALATDATAAVAFATTDLPDGPAVLTVMVSSSHGAVAAVHAGFVVVNASGDTTRPHEAPYDGDPTDGGGGPGEGERPDEREDQEPTAPAVPSVALLSWAPPVLTNPITIHVGVTGGIGRLDTSRDYLLVMPAVPRREGLVIDGGRNVVLIGGEISIPHQGPNPTINQRRGLHIANATGVVHVEGLLLHGDDISEGVQTRAPGAIVQLQNLAVLNLHARDQVGFTDNHPDVIQTWGSVKELRVDRLTGETDYQGLFFKADYHGPHGPVTLRNVNIRPLPTARYLFWTSNQGGGYPTITLDEVWVDPAPGRSFARTVWPESGSVISAGTAAWPSLPVHGVVRQGVPAGGDFVPASSVGLGYVSPGYR